MSMVRRIEVTGTGGVRLAAWDYADQHKPRDEHAERADGFGTPRGGLVRDECEDDYGYGPAPDGSRPAVLLLHGLMGRASHWAATARALAARWRPVALDQRGHGRSERPDGPYSREAYVADAVAAIEQLGLGPVTVIGHSMGALTAWQLAARRPDLVRALVICDMRASALGEATQREWEQWFASWPLPFATLADVRKWFGSDDPVLERPRPARGAFFTEVMEEHADGWWPLFSFGHMLSSREPWIRDAHWDDLAHVRCPTLVVRGWDGELGRAEAQEMVRVLPHGAYAEIENAGHHVPWDQPAAWQSVVESFLAETLISPDSPDG